MTGWDATNALPGLSPDSAGPLERIAPMEVAKGTVLFNPGETVKGFVVVLSGRVEVFLTGPSGREILLYSVEPGQSCVQSTLGLMGGEEYSGEAIAATNARVVLIPKDIFLSLLDRDTGFRGFVFHAFARRLQSMMHLLERVAFQRIESRLAQVLIDRAEDGRIHATHAELAAMIGSAREVVSRRLDALARRSILRLERGSVEIRDSAALQEIARDDV
ncbi:Crp/Fnr family transcriptional regulator [Aestuariivita boseongensis]|uniref:Crp/Fnr family transcriptional regulator n=1 Tax=Aestuariivita boseongensis TaxID=1470562 RepID=UPI00068060A9|nr:Crp/Fnr family transcriptional regulator [Aestuariivita boseongensis]